MELKGSRTEQNLMTAFAGESQARNKYTYFASVAKKEGYEQISAIFENTANNEKEHAKMWFKELLIDPAGLHAGSRTGELSAQKGGQCSERIKSFRAAHAPASCDENAGLGDIG